MHKVFNPAFQEALLAEVRICMKIASDMQARLHEDGFIQRKPDGSPVTLGDLTVQKRLEDFFASHTPDWPFIGEENVTPWTVDGQNIPNTFWLCDPIDGTQDYASGGKEYAINLALVENGRAIYGLIAGPGRGTIAYMTAPDRVVFEDKDAQKIPLAPPPSVPVRDAGLVVGHGRQKDVDAFEDMIGGKARSVLHCASALKFHALLLGECQAYLRIRETSEWDIAAGDALVAALGGYSGGIDRKTPFQYGRADREFKLSNVFVSFTHEHQF